MRRWNIYVTLAVLLEGANAISPTAAYATILWRVSNVIFFGKL